MSVKISNNATSTLSANISNSDTAIALPTGDGAKFPSLSGSDWFPATIVDASGNIEIVKVTARASDTLTVSRGQEGTTARAFVAGCRIDLRLTAAAIAEIQTNIADLQTLAATLAPLDSAALTGDPTAPTPTAGDDSTAVATTDFVVNAIAAGVTKSGDAYAGVPSGTVVFTIKQTAPAGWLLFADQTIGDASSGATYANVDALNIFTDLYAAADADCPVFTSAGSASTRSALGSAAAAWAAHARMSMPKALGHAFAAAGAGSGLTSRALASAVGEETHVLSTGEMPAHNHGVNDTGHVHGEQGSAVSGTGLAGILITGNLNSADAGDVTGYHTETAETGITIQNAGGGAAHNNIQPTTFLNAMVKK